MSRHDADAHGQEACRRPWHPGERVARCSVAAFGGPPAGTLESSSVGCAHLGEGDLRPAGRGDDGLDGQQRKGPPFEGRSSNPDDGRRYRHDPVPRRQASPTSAVRGGEMRTVSPTSLTNPGLKVFASFTSGSPRTGDSWLKPDTQVRASAYVLTEPDGNGRHDHRVRRWPRRTVAGIAALVWAGSSVVA